MKIISPSVGEDIWGQKIHWGYFDEYTGSFLVSNLQKIWELNITEKKFKHVFSKAEAVLDGESITDLAMESLLIFSAKKVNGFECVNLSKSVREFDSVGEVFMHIQDASYWGLNGRLIVQHPNLPKVNIFFRDSSVKVAEKIKKFPNYTGVHHARNKDTSFFVGNNQGGVFLHRLNESGVYDSKKIYNLNCAITGMALNEQGDELFVASVGMVTWLREKEGRFSVVFELACAVRHLIWSDEVGLLVCKKDQVSLYEINSDINEISEYWSKKLGFAIHQVSVDFERKQILCIPQNAELNLELISYEVSTSLSRYSKG